LKLFLERGIPLLLDYTVVPKTSETDVRVHAVMMRDHPWNGFFDFEILLHSWLHGSIRTDDTCVSIDELGRSDITRDR